MISSISTGIVKWLLKTGAISQQDNELYEYAAYSFLFSLLPLCLVAALGCIMGVLLEGILMILPFMMIRKFSGGFHLKSSRVCFVASTCILSVFLLVIKAGIAAQHVVFFSVFVSLSAIQVFLCSPIDNDSRMLKEKERLVFRRTARVMTLLFLVLYVFLLAFKMPMFYVPIGIGIILSALLQVPCFFL